jgi:hypothetical protein
MCLAEGSSQEPDHFEVTGPVLQQAKAVHGDLHKLLPLKMLEAIVLDYSSQVLK